MSKTGLLIIGMIFTINPELHRLLPDIFIANVAIIGDAAPALQGTAIFPTEISITKAEQNSIQHLAIFMETEIFSKRILNTIDQIELTTRHLGASFPTIIIHINIHTIMVLNRSLISPIHLKNCHKWISQVSNL